MTVRRTRWQIDRAGKQEEAALRRQPWEKEKINVSTISSGSECAALRAGFRWYLGPSLYVHTPHVCL